MSRAVVISEPQKRFIERAGRLCEFRMALARLAAQGGNHGIAAQHRRVAESFADAAFFAARAVLS